METNSSQSNTQSAQAGKKRFCSYCGSELDTGARFCKICGEVVEQPVTSSESNTGARLEHESDPCKPNSKSASYSQRDTTANEPNTERRTYYAGEILKCPNCGEVIESFVATCPACGYELRNVKVSKSISEFAKQLKQIESQRTDRKNNHISKTDEQVISLITSFPVPNTKEDLFEFVTLASSNIDVSILSSEISNINPQKAICKAWKSKLDQVYNKSILVFDGNDAKFIKIKNLYNQIQMQLQEQNETEKRKYKIELVLSMSGSIISVLLLVVAIIIGLIGNHGMDSSRANFILIIACVILVVSSILAGKKDSGIISPLATLAASVIFLIIGVLLPIISRDSMDSSRSVATIMFASIALIISIVGMLKMVKTTKRK